MKYVLYILSRVFWIVTPCRFVVGYQRFRGSCCLHIQVKVGILPQHYTVSQPRRN